MQMRERKEAGMTIIEMLVVIAILGIFMGIAIPSVVKSFTTMQQAKRITVSYPEAWRALNRVSEMVRQTYPLAASTEASFQGRNGSYDAGEIKIPSDELTFLVFDTGYARFGSVQKISYRLEPRAEDSPGGLVQIRSALGSEDTGVRETLLKSAVGLDFSYLDGSVEPWQWVQQWPASQQGAELTRPPKAVKITVFMLKQMAREPKSFTTIVNVPSG